MIRGNQYKHKGINLIIAFAVFWVSFASVINFHIQDNHGADVLGHLEFVKTEMKQSFKKDSTFSFKINLHSESLIRSTNEDLAYHICSPIIPPLNLAFDIYMGCFQEPILRGPPVFL